MMKNHLHKNTVLVAGVLVALIGCSGPDKGLEIGFTDDAPVEFATASIDASIDEENGSQSIDLLEGSTVGGSPLTSTPQSPVFIREFVFDVQDPAFQTPQTGTGVSPFSIPDNGTALEIDTDMFAAALRMCDTTDVRGATDAMGNPIGDGVRDFPQSIDYVITFVVDNGYEYPPGQAHPTRTLNLTVSANDDPVTDVQAFDIAVAAGDTVPMTSATAPSYACNPALTYMIADTNIATVDVDGNITGVTRGDTTITVTSVENPALTATAALSITPGFNLNITNQDFNALGAPLGTKTVPACIDVGISVEPSIVGDALTGAYTYTWSSVNAAAPLAMEEGDGSFGATGRFTNALAVGEMSDITVGYGTGYTGATLGADVVDQSVTVTAIRNHACDPIPDPGGVGYVSDLALNTGGWGGLATAIAGGGLDAAGSVLITAPGGDITTVVQQVWNQGRNFGSQYYGRGTASTGRTFTFSVWARLGQVPTGGDVVLDHTLLPWACSTCGGTGFPGRRPQAESVTATLKPTTDWQLVEFINPQTGTTEWSVPAIWDLNTAMFLHWDVYGLANGETIEIDSYSVVEL